MILEMEHEQRAARVTARCVMGWVTPVTPATLNDAVYARFQAEKDLQTLPVVEDGIPRGIINRLALIGRFIPSYAKAFRGEDVCAGLMNANPLIVSSDISIGELSYLLADGEKNALADGFIVVQDGRYAGVGSAQQLLRELVWTCTDAGAELQRP